MFISEWQESLKQYFVVTSDARMELISWKKKLKLSLQNRYTKSKILTVRQYLNFSVMVSEESLFASKYWLPTTL